MRPLRNASLQPTMSQHLAHPPPHPLSTYTACGSLMTIAPVVLLGHSPGGACSTSRPAAPVEQQPATGQRYCCTRLQHLKSPSAVQTPHAQPPSLVPIGREGTPALQAAARCSMQPEPTLAQPGRQAAPHTQPCCVLGAGTRDTSGLMMYRWSRGAHLRACCSLQGAAPQGPNVWGVLVDASHAPPLNSQNWQHGRMPVLALAAPAAAAGAFHRHQAARLRAAAATCCAVCAVCVWTAACILPFHSVSWCRPTPA